MSVLENKIALNIMMEENVKEEHYYNNENITQTILYHTKKGQVTPQNITLPAIMDHCEDIINRDINENETENNRDTLDKVIEEFPCIASPAILDDCEDMIHRDMNENEK